MSYILRALKKTQMITQEQALPGRGEKIKPAQDHFVLNVPLVEPYPDAYEQLIVGMGCFWGAERKFWQLDGVYVTAVGYSAGFTPNPTYDEVCSGMTGHNEVVLVVYDPKIISTKEVLKVFWENHNPTQGMRQGNDSGTQYRSGIYYANDTQKVDAFETKSMAQKEATKLGLGDITTEILPTTHFYFAEDYHQQYLAKNPNGYCGLGGAGICIQA